MSLTQTSYILSAKFRNQYFTLHHYSPLMRYLKISNTKYNRQVFLPDTCKCVW